MILSFFRYHRFIISFFIIGFLACFSSLNAADQVVTSNSDSGVGTLREAIAAVGSGETITFNLGAGDETITLTSQISISDSMTIDGSNTAGSGTAVTVQVTDPGISAWRVFYIGNSGDITNINDMTIKGGNVTSGGAIESRDGELNLENVTISNSKAQNGGGIYLHTAGELSLVNCEIKTNTATSSGAGIKVGATGSLTISKSVISGNAATFYGGGVYNVGSATISDSTIKENTAGAGAGIYAAGSGTFHADSCAILDNTANDHGGGIAYVDTGDVTLVNCTISGNDGGDGGIAKGGAIYDNSTAGIMTIVDSTICGNYATAAGGIYNKGDITITNSIVAYNYLADLSDYEDIINNGGTVYGNYNIAGDWDVAWDGTGNTDYTYASGKGSTLFDTYTQIVLDTIYSPVVEDNYGPTYTADIPVGSTGATNSVIAGSYDDSGTTKYAFSADGGSTWKAVEDATAVAEVVSKITTDQRGYIRSSASYSVGAYGYNASPPYYYRTAATGSWNWSVTANWEQSTDNATWGAADDAPTANSLGITILTSTTVTLDSNLTINKVTINSGGTLVVGVGVTFTLSNGSGDDLTVTGTLTNNGTITIEEDASVVYNGGDQAVLALAYNSLSFTGSTSASTKTFADGITSIKEKITIDDAITLTGSAVGAVTVQVETPDAGGTESKVFKVDASGETITISNITIKGGDISGKADAYKMGGAIYLVDGDLELDTVNVSNSKAYSGGGVYCASGTLTISDSTISNNTSTTNGGGVYCASDTSTISDSTISNNTSTTNGGGLYFASGTLTISGNTISSNTSTTNGGGIYCASGTLTITGSTISSNTSDGSTGSIHGGGIYCDAADLTISTTTISDNSSNGYGGGAYCYENGSLDISSSTISGNSTDLFGAGLYTKGSTKINNCTIADNTSSKSGGGVYSNATPNFVYIINSTISGNSATNDGGGLLLAFSETVYLANTIITNNSASDNGVDIYTQNASKLYAYYSWYSEAEGDGYIYTKTIAPNRTTAYTASDLDALANNGGATETMEVVLGAPADGRGEFMFYNATDGYYLKASDDDYYKLVDLWGGTSFVPGDPNSDKITTDQRGETRVAPVTIGAYYTAATYYMAKSDGTWATTGIWFTNTTGGITPGDYTAAATETPNAGNSMGIVLNSTVTVDAGVTIDQTTINVTTGALTIDDGITVTVSDGVGTDLDVNGTITVSGTGSMEIDGAFDATGGNVTFSGAGSLTFGGDVTSLGTFTCNTGSVVYNGATQDIIAETYYNLTLGGTEAKACDGNIIVGGVFNATQNLTIAGGGVGINVTGASFIGGDINTNNNQTYQDAVTLTDDVLFTSSSGNISFDSVAGQTSSRNLSVSVAAVANASINGAINSNIGTITKQGAGDFDTNNNNISATGLSIEGGTFNNDNNSGTWDVNGDVSISNGATLAATSGTFTVSGNWSNSGTFTHNSKTVALDGTAQQISGTTTFYNLTKNVAAADTLTFAAGTTTTVTGALSLQGAAGALLSLRSSGAAQWNIKPDGTRTISYADVQYSNNTSGTFIDVIDDNCTDSGNNTSWAFINPTVTTQAVSDIGTVTATGNGTINPLGDYSITQHGICWSTASDPTILNSKTEEGATTLTGAFTGSITGLSNNTTYYVRAYATNTAGTVYGSDVSFTTSSQMSTVTTQAVSDVLITTATGNGNITDLGDPNPTQYGVCWSTSADPTTADTKTEEGASSAIGAFTSTITGLSAGTTYHVRAYATNTAGTAYGDDISFTTDSQAATVTTQAVSAVAITTATGNGNITGLGAPNPTQYGVCWGTSADPTTTDSKTEEGAISSIGAFTSDITGLSGNATYHVRAYATNTAGTAYGTDVTFTTDPQAATVTTQAVSDVAIATATGNGNITDLGAPNPTQYGVCWGTSADPTIADNKTEEGAASATGAFTSGITGLSAGVTYHVRAYATNTADTVYGTDVSFTTGSQVATVTTQAVSDIAITTATGNGNITDLGDPDPTQYGVCWSTSADPTTADSKTEEGITSATGAFTSDITGLSVDTTYHVRAYATNTAGTTYGDDVLFSTSLSITIGSIMTVDAANISNIDAEFSKRPSFYGKYEDPVKEKDYKGTMKTITTVGSTQLCDNIQYEWRKYVYLYDKADLSKKNKAGQTTAAWLIDFPIANLDCALWIKTTNIDKSKEEKAFRDVVIAPPTITSITCWNGDAIATGVHTGSNVIINGTYFGSKTPTVSLEYTDGGKIKQKRLKVLSIYYYDDNKGNVNKSCMDLYETSTSYARSKIRVEMPKWWSNWTAGTYSLILSNKIGITTGNIATTASETVTNTAPVANNDALTLIAGSSYYYIDVFADNGSGVDEDADSDTMTVTYADKGKLASGGKITYDKNKFKIKYVAPRAYDASTIYTDVFNYTLSDNIATTTSTGAVTITINPITLTSVTKWNGAALGNVQEKSQIILNGTDFGIKTPSVYLIYTDSKSNKKTKKLKVVSKAQYADYNGKANKSYTDVDPNSATFRESHITVEMPTSWWSDWTAGDYTLLIDNKFDTDESYTISTVTDEEGNLPPTAQEDDITIYSGSKYYYLDVLADNGSGVDTDLRSDKIKIIPVSTQTDKGGKLNFDSKTNTIRYIRPKAATATIAEFTDHFQYYLQDNSKEDSNIVDVNITIKLNP